VLSVDPMTQIAIYQQEQTALIKTMAKDFNGKFTEALDESLAKASEPLNQTMKGFVSGITREQARLIDAVLTRFIERMNDTLDGELKRFGSVLDETSQLQKESFESVRASLSGASQVFSDLQEMQSVIREMLEGMSAYTQQLSSARAEADDAYMRLQSAAETMELVSRQETGYLKTVSAVQADISRATENMTAALTRFANRFAEENNGTASAMQSAAVELKTAGEKLAEVHQEATKSIRDELNATLDAYRDYVNQFTQRVDYLASSISGALEQMPDAVSETNNRFLDQMDAMTDTLDQAQRALNDAVNRLYGGR